MAAGPGPWQPNLSLITDTIAVGGRFPTERAAELARDHGVRAVVDLRAEARHEEAELTRHGIALLHLPTNDHFAVSPAMIDDGVSFASAALDRGERVLVHCTHGIGRSATLALCLMVDRGWEPLAALALMKDRRALVSPSPAQYHCWVEWLARLSGATRPGWEIPSFDAFKAIAYRHLPPVL